MTSRADITVVGGGIVGCMIAGEIVARAPRRSVVLIDRDEVGGGASRLSAGLHVPRGATDRVRRMTEYSHDFYLRLKACEPSLPIHRVRMSVVAGAGSAARIDEVYLDRAALTRAEAPAHPTGYRVPEESAVWHSDGCQYADVYALTKILAGRLRQRVDVREGVRVEAIDRAGTGVHVRLSTGETIRSERVVLAPGPWLHDPAWRELVAPLGVRVKKVVALHLSRPATAGEEGVLFQDEDAFLLPFPHRGHWLYSYTCREWDVEPDSVRGGLTAADLAAGREILARYRATEHACTSGRVFCDAYSPDGEPLVHTFPDDRLVFAGAANGSGYRLAPAIAAEAADQLELPRSQP